MNRERWQQIEALMQAVRDRTPQQRALFLDQECNNDAELRREVEVLLANESQMGDTQTAMSEPAKPRLNSGAQVGPYKIEAVLGEGGMGTVFRARDTRLGRTVAIKLIRSELAQRGDFRHRFEREARTISALNHPHICGLHDIGQQDGSDYLVMEFVEGETLAAVLKKGLLPLDLALRYGAQTADALAAAHARGIVHRDLKPGNIMITEAGVKVLDFGLAKHAEHTPDEETSATHSEDTHAGQIVGTAAYMSPEQAQGKPVDAHSDMFSLGVVLYEMLCGRHPFRGDTTLATLAAILNKNPEAPRKIRQQIPEDVERMLLSCLEKAPEARCGSASALHRELETHQGAGVKPAILRRPVVAAAALLLVISGGALAAQAYLRVSRTRWVEKEALPQISHLLEKRQPVAALRLLRQAKQYAPSSPALIQLRSQALGSPISIRTNPAAASIYVRDYADAEDGDLSHWEFLGKSPLETGQLPAGLYRLRAVKDGSEGIERAVTIGSGANLLFEVPESAKAQAGMVLVPGISAAGAGAYPAVTPQLAEFWLDKYEVTNRQFKDFVDHGGYQKREYWKHPFIKDGAPIPWERAMADFRDATGRPGPATWELGTYGEGKADFPVGGVSWYEASAYAEFAGKSLPTAYHWYRASGVGFFAEIMTTSNFGGQGLARVGAYRGLGPFGTYDMAGNVKEWTSSPAEDRFYILGGGWNEQSYLFNLPDARRPFERATNFGFRCAKYTAPLPPEMTGPVPFVSRDRRLEKSADDKAYQIYKSLHTYDRTDLKPVIESTDESSPYWRKQVITYQAAYGNDRVLAHLYLPKNAAPPYQVVTFFPGANALAVRSIQEMGYTADFIVRSGRALLVPAYKGTLERGPSEYYHQLGQPARWTEMNLQWSKDLGRSIDYLETRSDIDTKKLGFCGVSLGAAMAPRLIAVEPRFKAALLFQAGTFEKVPPEVDAWNFAPHVKIPVLILNGRDDFRFPLETSQVPLFKALGTPEKDKRLVLFEGGHDTITRVEAVREALNWLDRYLAPVKLQ